MTGATAGQSPLAMAVDSFGWRTTQFAAAGTLVLLACVIWTVARDGAAAAPVRPRGQGITLPKVASVMRDPQTWIVGVVVATSGAILMTFAGLWSVPFLMEGIRLLAGCRRPSPPRTS